MGLEVIISTMASLITAALVIAGATRKGRTWLIRPIVEDNAKIKEEILSVKRGTLRTELLLLIRTDPKNSAAIFEVYEKYHGLGGNFYIDDIFAKWRRAYAGAGRPKAPEIKPISCEEGAIWQQN